ncbi:hypothetical protein N7527_007570 [Penicillium freii]|nr:hypothetical protein N7527_007570 [Penicillium freii]
MSSTIILSKHRRILNKQTTLSQGVHFRRIRIYRYCQSHRYRKKKRILALHEPTPNPIEDELERQLQSELLVPNREIVSDINTGNILSRRRIYRVRRDSDFVYIIITTVRDKEPPALLYTFAAGLYIEKPDSHRYRDNLPLPLKY